MSGPVCRFIRSPWPEVSLAKLLRAMRARVVRFADWETNEERGAQVAGQVLAMHPATLLADAHTYCHWCSSPLALSAQSESRRLGLAAEGAWACEDCLADEIYRHEPPDAWDEHHAWPFLNDG